MVQCFSDFYRTASNGMLLFETISFQGPVEALAERWELSGQPWKSSESLVRALGRPRRGLGTSAAFWGRPKLNI